MTKNGKGKSKSSKENFEVLIENPILYDKLHTLSIEYSMSVETLVYLAVKRLLDDVDFVRRLRAGRIKKE